MNSKIVIFGDICPDNNYRSLFDNNKNGPFSQEIIDYLQDVDIVIGNLECPATKSSKPIMKCGPSLKAKIEDIARLKGYGFDILSMANNHILDYDMTGVYETLNECDKCGISFVGAGANERESKIPIIKEVSGKRIGIISFAEEEFNIARGNLPGANCFDPYTSFDDVKRLKYSCDYVIVLYHGGIEYYKNPSPLLQKKCRKFAESGADIVLCQHSHCIGTIEKVDDCTIIYGQGNSVFGYREGNDSWNEGLLIEIDVDNNYSIDLKLLNSTSNGVVFADSVKSQQRLEILNNDSSNLNNAKWIYDEWTKFVKTQEALDLALLFGWNRVLNKLNRILGNTIINMCFSKRQFMTSMNLVRCEAHHEVVKTILENKSM